MPPQTKSRLREIFWEQDVLVLPSLGDSFGFVAMEAMACGLPVIVTESCGVPVPERTWRVPARNSEALAARLAHYAEGPDRARADASIAQEFAAQFTPERYRARIRELFSVMLKRSSACSDNSRPFVEPL
jgi:glycosyltransferase involved in cell wall biosynthesis